MITQTAVRFDALERRVIAEALIGIHVAYETPGESPEARALRTAADGASLDHRLLDRAEACLSRLIEVCERERDVQYWLSQAPGDEVMAEATVAAAVPLIADPPEMARVIAEARAVMLRQAVAAHTIITEAQRRIPAGEREALEAFGRYANA